MRARRAAFKLMEQEHITNAVIYNIRDKALRARSPTATVRLVRLADWLTDNLIYS